MRKTKRTSFKKLITTSLIFLSGSILMNCSEDDNSEFVKSDQFYPLIKGNVWEYNFYEPTSNGSALLGKMVKKVSNLVRTPNPTLDGKVFAETEHYDEHSKVFFNYNTDSGYVAYGELQNYMQYVDASSETTLIYNGPDTLVSNSLIAKFPVKTGDKWGATSFGYTLSHTNSSFQIGLPDTTFVLIPEIELITECINGGVQIETKAGIFDCVVYKFNVDYKSYYVSYYSDGFGEIMRENYQDGILESYRILMKMYNEE